MFVVRIIEINFVLPLISKGYVKNVYELPYMYEHITIIATGCACCNSFVLKKNKKNSFEKKEAKNNKTERENVETKINFLRNSLLSALSLFRKFSCILLANV